MNELRQDPVSGDWIILATERAQRPHDLLPKKTRKRQPSPISKCPFEDLKKSGNWPPIIAVPNGRNWRVTIIPNRYPALKHGRACASSFATGPYKLVDGVGHHDLAITRDHRKNWAHLGENEGLEFFKILQRRYRELKKDKCLVYTSMFFNWGESAGASLYHPHAQMITLPIIPPGINHSLDGSANYFRKHRRCVHCKIIKFEEKSKARIIFRNSSALAIAPFFSKRPFQIKIFPRHHRPYFEKTASDEIKGIFSALRSVLLKIEKNLRDPDFNFFIHTSPLKNQDRYKHYHWHVEILPKISIPAGFELGTGVDINVVDPDMAAAILRK